MEKKEKRIKMKITASITELEKQGFDLAAKMNNMSVDEWVISRLIAVSTMELFIYQSKQKKND